MNNTIREIVAMAFELRKRKLPVSIYETNQEVVVSIIRDSKRYQLRLNKEFGICQQDFLKTIGFLRSCI